MTKYYSVVEAVPVKLSPLCHLVRWAIRILCRGCDLRDTCSVYLSWDEESEKDEAPGN